MEEVLRERITKAQKGGTQYMVALRDGEVNIMEGVEMGVGGKIAARN